MLIGLRLGNTGYWRSWNEDVVERGAMESDMWQRCCAWFRSPDKTKQKVKVKVKGFNSSKLETLFLQTHRAAEVICIDILLFVLHQARPAILQHPIAFPTIFPTILTLSPDHLTHHDIIYHLICAHDLAAPDSSHEHVIQHLIPIPIRTRDQTHDVSRDII